MVTYIGGNKNILMNRSRCAVFAANLCMAGFNSTEASSKLALEQTLTNVSGEKADMWQGGGGKGAFIIWCCL